MINDEKTFHLILVYNSDSHMGKAALVKMYEIAGKGFRKFAIYVISPLGKPYYIEKLRDLISNNIAYTLVIKYIGPSTNDLVSLANVLKDKPHLVLISPDMNEYYNTALIQGLNVEKIS